MHSCASRFDESSNCTTWSRFLNGGSGIYVPPGTPGQCVSAFHFKPLGYLRRDPINGPRIVAVGVGLVDPP